MNCEYYFDHEPYELCKECGLEVDGYGNTSEDFINCSFPDCGCDGSRLCMAPSGANTDSENCNVEGMHERKDKEAVQAKIGLLDLVNNRYKLKGE